MSVIDMPKEMTSSKVRDLMPEDLPAVAMPECDVRKILKGQKALVTGANSGIGKAIAIALCRAGADVVINYRNGDEAAQAVVEEATHCGCSTNGRAIIHKADVSKEDEVQAMFKRTIDEFGTIDILVPNAGLQQD